MFRKILVCVLVMTGLVSCNSFELPEAQFKQQFGSTFQLVRYTANKQDLTLRIGVLDTQNICHSKLKAFSFMCMRLFHNAIEPFNSLDFRYNSKGVQYEVNVIKSEYGEQVLEDLMQSNYKQVEYMYLHMTPAIETHLVDLIYLANSYYGDSIRIKDVIEILADRARDKEAYFSSKKTLAFLYFMSTRMLIDEVSVSLAPYLEGLWQARYTDSIQAFNSEFELMPDLRSMIDTEDLLGEEYYLKETATE